MISNTTLSAIRALIYLGQSGKTTLPPRQIADALGESPSYLAKVLGSLVKAGILRAVRGVKGGVQFNRPLEEISLLSIMETCQGVVVESYCRSVGRPEEACAFHQAALELHQATVRILSRWNLAHMLAQPRPVQEDTKECLCRLSRPESSAPGGLGESAGKDISRRGS